LKLILKECTSSRSYDSRVANLRNGLGPVLAPSGTKLKRGVTVFDDLDVDKLYGGTNLDWLLFDLNSDLAYNKKATEAVN